MAFGATSIKGLALRFLARREHSRVELERKLRRRIEDSAEDSADDGKAGSSEGRAEVRIAAALDDLVAKDLLSDRRTAESVLRTQGQKFGIRRLKQTLLSKGLEADLVTSTLAQARLTELQRAQDIWRRRFGQPAGDAKDRARQIRFLAGRGFDFETIRSVVQAREEDGA